jgi:hypothetical protein
MFVPLNKEFSDLYPHGVNIKKLQIIKRSEPTCDLHFMQTKDCFFAYFISIFLRKEKFPHFKEIILLTLQKPEGGS